MSKSFMRIGIIIASFFCYCSSFAQLLKGQIVDTSGTEIPFARVGIVNTSYGTVANAEGKFQLKVSTGPIILQITAADFETHIDSLEIVNPSTSVRWELVPIGSELEEIIVTKKSKKDRGKEIMKEVIDRRKQLLDTLAAYDVTLYVFSSLESPFKDTIQKDSIIGKKKMNITEQFSHSFYQASQHYKDSIFGFVDCSEKVPVTSSVSVSFSSPEQPLQPVNKEEINPYLFVGGLHDGDVNLYENQQLLPRIAQRPFISPLAFNAFVYYNFYLNQSFYRADGQLIYELKVVPRFKEEALYEGLLFVADGSFELVAADLSFNKSVLNYFNALHMVCDYEKKEGRLVPVRREFSYEIKEGAKTINGSIRMAYSNYRFNHPRFPSKFWLSTQITLPDATTKDSTFWNAIRPIPLKESELQFIREQDKIAAIYASEAYLKSQDSTYNTLNVWDFLFNGIGFRSSFKKQSFYIHPLTSQVIPFGVGGYRHRLGCTYNKEFKNGKAIYLQPIVDYGFYNRDFKWELNGNVLYNPRRFSRVHIQIGDIYDLMNSYQSIQGTLAPANRVRNKKVEIGHSFELFNGLYLKTSIFYSDRQSISNITYPKWVSYFGNFAQPSSFEGYRILMTEIDFEYHFHQRYILKNNRKIIVGSQWPIAHLTYKKGIPHVLGGQSDFDYLEVRVTDQLNLHQFGKSEFKFIAGTFLRKNDLRIVEHKFFRTSDAFFFSNPVNSLQLLDTALNTSNSFLQFNVIHHFEGFFLNKIWGINRLKLQETVGGSVLLIPDAHFAQTELYIGLERQLRIKKQLFKIGVYAVTADSSFDKMKLTYKVGVNFYNSFFRKWDY
jgi:hypothetical protein